VYRLAVAWALAQSPNVIPIPGATRPQSILDDVAALSMSLTPDQVTWLHSAAAAR
jgi:aryl-alcohol dehydrogenase-like predicted oxidoreductase